MTTIPITARLARNLDAAFEDFVLAFQDGIYSGILRLTRDPDDAEDLTQETFIRAYRALHAYEPERRRALAIEGWLWTIALNLCRNRARTRSRKPRLVPIDDADPASSLDTESEALASHGPLAEALASLPRDQRESVVLRHVVGLDYRAMSEALGRPEGTLKSDVHRGLRRLEMILGAHHD